MRSRNKVAIILPYLKSRGTERQGLAIAKDLKSRGWLVTVIILEQMGDYFSAFEKEGFDIHVISNTPLAKHGILPFNQLMQLVKLIKKEKVDIIISRAGMSNKTTMKAGYLARKPTLIFISGAIMENKAKNIIKEVYRSVKDTISYMPAARIIAVSKVGADRIKKANPLNAKKVRILNNGVDIDMIKSNLSKGEKLSFSNYFSIIYAGSLDEQRKGLDVLIHGFSIFSKGKADCRLILVGSGRDHEKLETLVKETKTDNLVIFAGEQHNPFPYYHAASVFVLPSRKEGFPNALLEAMAVGLPVIAADCETGPSEIINYGTNGILVPVEDKEALSLALDKLYNDRALCKKLGKNAQKTIESDYKFSDKMNQLEMILLELIDRS